MGTFGPSIAETFEVCTYDLAAAKLVGEKKCKRPWSVGKGWADKLECLELTDTSGRKP
jgi:hypothetical protein